MFHTDLPFSGLCSCLESFVLTRRPSVLSLHLVNVCVTLLSVLTQHCLRPFENLLAMQLDIIVVALSFSFSYNHHVFFFISLTCLSLRSFLRQVSL